MTPTAPSPDLLLARRAAAGQSEAWDELVERLGRRIYNLAFQFAGGAEGADDLTQEVFLRLFRNLGKYRGDVPLAAWALRLSRNLCIDHYRQTRRLRRWEVVSEEVLEQVASKDDPQAEAQRRQQLEAVYGALSELPESYAEVLVLRDLQGWSFEETASYLDLPMGTLKSRLFRARNALTDLLGHRAGAVEESLQ